MHINSWSLDIAEDFYDGSKQEDNNACIMTYASYKIIVYNSIGVGRYWRLGGPSIQLRAKCARKIYNHAQFVSNHTPFCMIETTIVMKKINCKSNGIDLEAIEAHSLMT